MIGPQATIEAITHARPMNANYILKGTLYYWADSHFLIPGHFYATSAFFIASTTLNCCSSVIPSPLGT